MHEPELGAANLPLAQLVQAVAPAAEYLSTVQKLQLPSWAYWPLGQLPEGADAPILQYWPVGQVEHMMEPPPAAYCPAGQRLQLLPPEEAW